jgi:hypothetical protein
MRLASLSPSRLKQKSKRASGLVCSAARSPLLRPHSQHILAPAVVLSPLLLQSSLLLSLFLCFSALLKYCGPLRSAPSSPYTNTITPLDHATHRPPSPSKQIRSNRAQLPPSLPPRFSILCLASLPLASHLLSAAPLTAQTPTSTFPTPTLACRSRSCRACSGERAKTAVVQRSSAAPHRCAPPPPARRAAALRTPAAAPARPCCPGSRQAAAAPLLGSR